MKDDKPFSTLDIDDSEVSPSDLPAAPEFVLDASVNCQSTASLRKALRGAKTATPITPPEIDRQGAVTAYQALKKRTARETREEKIARGVPRYLVESPESKLPREAVTFTVGELRGRLGRFCSPKERDMVLSILVRFAEYKANYMAKYPRRK